MKEGLMSFTDEGEQRRIMAHALAGGRLTWNVAVPWPEADLPRLGNRRYILVDGEAGEEDPRGKLDRSLLLPMLSDVVPVTYLESGLSL
jgi:hypothetical protein